jgi:nucleotide-binding universal stress UspA family protein
MSRVLAAIDTSPCARSVLDTAQSIASLFDGTAVAIHVTENDDDTAGDLARDAGIDLAEIAGFPVEAIVAAAAAPDVAALVIGARGTDRGRQPAGHTALDVIARVRKPIVVVPPGETPRAKLARVLVPLEGTTKSSQAIERALALTDRADLEIVVLHVHPPQAVPAFQDQPHHAISAWQREFTERYVQQHRGARVIQHVGVAADRVVPTAREVDAGLIVLAWNQDLTQGRARVIRETLAQSSIPILLVPMS